MNMIFPFNKRTTHHLPFNRGTKRPLTPASAAILSTHELKRIVAAMIG